MLAVCVWMTVAPASTHASASFGMCSSGVMGTCGLRSGLVTPLSAASMITGGAAALAFMRRACHSRGGAYMPCRRRRRALGCARIGCDAENRVRRDAARALPTSVQRSPRSPGRSSTMPCSRGSRPIPSGGRACSSTSCGPAWSTRVRSVRCGWRDRLQTKPARTGRSRPWPCGFRRAAIRAARGATLGYAARSIARRTGGRPAPAARRATAQPSRRSAPARAALVSRRPRHRPVVPTHRRGHRAVGTGARAGRRGGLPAYLETQKEANLAWYGRFGFDVVERVDVGPCPPIWTMRRAERAPTP